MTAQQSHGRSAKAPLVPEPGQQPTPRQAMIADALANGLPALQHGKDFALIADVVAAALTVEFTGEGRDTPTGKGIRGIQWSQFEYSNTIVVPGVDEYKTGWTMKMRFHLDSHLSVFPILKALERYGFRTTSGGQLQKHDHGKDSDHGFMVYILSDDYAVQALQRRFAECDNEPGAQSMKSATHRGWWRTKA